MKDPIKWIPTTFHQNNFNRFLDYNYFCLLLPFLTFSSFFIALFSNTFCWLYGVRWFGGCSLTTTGLLSIDSLPILMDFYRLCGRCNNPPSSATILHPLFNEDTPLCRIHTRQYCILNLVLVLHWGYNLLRKGRCNHCHRTRNDLTNEQDNLQSIVVRTTPLPLLHYC